MGVEVTQGGVARGRGDQLRRRGHVQAGHGVGNPTDHPVQEDLLGFRSDPRG